MALLALMPKRNRTCDASSRASHDGRDHGAYEHGVPSYASHGLSQHWPPAAARVHASKHERTCTCSQYTCTCKQQQQSSAAAATNAAAGTPHFAPLYLAGEITCDVRADTG